MGYVYCWINKLNDKYYLGSTNGKHCSYKGGGLIFKRAYKKNPNNFEKFIVYEGDDYRKLEEEMLEILDCKNDIMSYNLTNQAIIGGMFGKKQTNKQKDIVRKVNSKPIVQYSLSGEKIKEFSNITEASKEIGCSVNNIVTCLKGVTKTASGFQWRYKSDNIEKLEKIKSKQERQVNNRKKVDKYNLDGEYLETYNSIKEAANSVNLSYPSIQQCLTGKSKQSGGYIWKYNENKLVPEPD